MGVGKAEIVYETPDLVVIRASGALATSDAELLSNALKQAGRDRIVFLLSIVDGATFEMPGPVRRAFIEATRDFVTIYDAVVGASFHVRIIGKLVAGGARWLTGTELKLEFFDDEKSARAWLRQKGCIACNAERQSGPNRPD